MGVELEIEEGKLTTLLGENGSGKLFQRMVKDRKIDLNNNFQNFSRGQKMQVALMIGIASNPKVLLLDEITSVKELAVL